MAGDSERERGREGEREGGREGEGERESERDVHTLDTYFLPPGVGCISGGARHVHGLTKPLTLKLSWSY